MLLTPEMVGNFRPKYNHTGNPDVALFNYYRFALAYLLQPIVLPGNLVTIGRNNQEQDNYSLESPHILIPALTDEADLISREALTVNGQNGMVFVPIDYNASVGVTNAKAAYILNNNGLTTLSVGTGTHSKNPLQAGDIVVVGQANALQTRQNMQTVYQELIKPDFNYKITTNRVLYHFKNQFPLGALYGTAVFAVNATVYQSAGGYAANRYSLMPLRLPEN